MYLLQLFGLATGIGVIATIGWWLAQRRKAAEDRSYEMLKDDLDRQLAEALRERRGDNGRAGPTGRDRGAD